MRVDKASILNLRKTYLQLHIPKNLQRFQAVRCHGKLYVMTRMGFGFDIAAQVMPKILSTVLSIDHDIAAGMDHCIDDIFVNEQIVLVDVVREHLLNFGLVTEDLVAKADARVLGLRVYRDSDGVHS